MYVIHWSGVILSIEYFVVVIAAFNCYQRLSFVNMRIIRSILLFYNTLRRKVRYIFVERESEIQIFGRKNEIYFIEERCGIKLAERKIGG